MENTHEDQVTDEAQKQLQAVLDGEKQGIQLNDPHEVGGAMIESGAGPHDRHAVLFDTRNAILPEEFEFAIAHGTSDGDPMPDSVAMVVRGRINRPPDHQATREAPAEKVQYLNLMPWEAAADIVVDIQALAGRDGSSAKLRALLEERWADLQSRGLTTPVEGTS